MADFTSMSTKYPEQLSETDALVDLLRGQRIVVLAGAGCSTDSGIPDYRGPDSIQRARKPMQYQEFIGSEAARVRYWSRSMVGWNRIRTAIPNDGHRALAALEHSGWVTGVITQNVDGLHQRAGSTRVVELHGALARVCCLSCGRRDTREDYQRRLLDENPDWAKGIGGIGASAVSAPDGDADVEATAEDFRVPACRVCGGTIKPDVVFFGENVPRATVEQAYEMLGEASALLVAGSSLTVYSGRRFVYAAADRRLPIAIVNRGPTRADDLATLKVDAGISSMLTELATMVAPADPSGVS